MSQPNGELKYIVVTAGNAAGYKDLFSDIVVNGQPGNAVTVYKARNHIYRIPDPWGGWINIKDFKLPNVVNKYVYGNIRHSKARRSYDNALELLRLGFSTPQPMGYGEVIEGRCLTRSYYFSRQVDDIIEMRDVARHADWRELLFALGKEMARLHEAGVWMKDFSPGNVMFKRTPDGNYLFSYVDLNRIEFNCRSRAKLMKMFGAMVYSPAHLMAIAEGYASATGMKLKVVAREALIAMSRFEQRTARKQFLKQLLFKKPK